MSVQDSFPDEFRILVASSILGGRLAGTGKTAVYPGCSDDEIEKVARAANHLCREALALADELIMVARPEGP